MRPSSLLALAAVAASASTVGAQSILTNPGTAYRTAALSSARTAGADMAGLRVTAHFADGTQTSAAWSMLGEELFGVSTARFQLSVGAAVNTGSPGQYVWSLDNLWSGGLSRLFLSGAAGRTVFDMDGTTEGTPNSALGIPLAFAPDVQPDGTELPSIYAEDAIVTYRNAVSLVGATAFGDLYETMDLVFGRALVGGARLAFDLDTDTVGDGASLDPIGGGGGGGGGQPVSTVPEPGTMLLLTAGLAVMGVVGNRGRTHTR